MADQDGKVVDFSAVKAGRDAEQGFDEVMRASLRQCVEHIAEAHGGKSEEWIEARTAAAVAVLGGMVDVARTALPMTYPKSVREADIVVLQQRIQEIAADQNARCREAFANQLVNLLGP